MQLSVNVRNARLDAIETVLGNAATLELRSGPLPANCAAADAGTVLASVVLPADWMTDAAGGNKSLSGTWEDTAADAAGVAGHFRVKDSSGACHIQGECGLATDSPVPEMVLTNTNLAVGQPFSISSFTITDGNA